MEDLHYIPGFIQNPISWLLIAWLVRELWSVYIRGIKAQDEANRTFKVDVTGALKENSDRLASMTIVLVKLESKLDALEHLSMTVPKLTQDVSLLFEKIRVLEEA